MKNRRLIKICALGIIVMFISSAAFSQEKKEEVTRLLAETYLASGQNEKAIEVYREVIEKEPFDIKARISLAELVSWMKRYDESIVEYKKVLEIDPGNIEALKKMAEVYYWKGDLDNAELTYREILKINPNEKEVYASIGEILTWQKKYPEAIDYFSKALKEGKKGREKVLYGRALLYSGQYPMAEDVFVEVLEENPDNLEAKTYLADTYSYNKRFKEGITLYEEILKKKDDIKVKEKLADVLSWDKQYEKSFALYDEILNDKYDSKIHLQKARILGWARRYGEAGEEYQKILDKKHDELIELEMQAKEAYWNGRIKTAISKYNELIIRDPENVEAMFDLSQVYSYQSMWEDAISEYNRILALNPTHFRAREGLEKADLISRHVSLKTDYRFFEADSPSRDADIRKHQFLSNMIIPVNSKTFIDAGYVLTGRMFTDFHDILENEGRVKVTYLEKPDWQVSGYYGLIGYNKDIDELTHLFGADLGLRIMDFGVYSFFYDRQRLENNSTVIREHFYRNKFKSRVDLDVTRRLKVGADYLYAYYSDDNSLNEPGFDVLYYLSLEPKSLSVKYRYFYKEFNDKVGQYFSPKGFSTSKFTINWRHFLNKEEIFFGANDVYYDLKYDVLIDSTYIVGHKFTWEANYDVTKRLNLNVSGSVMGSSASVYQESEVKAGLKYYF
ncbi:tetratricopeptide repeat protein [Candidatus Omnitrophota bacterium]